MKPNSYYSSFIRLTTSIVVLAALHFSSTIQAAETSAADPTSLAEHFAKPYSSTTKAVEPITNSGVAGGLAVALAQDANSAAAIHENFQDKSSFVAQVLITAAEGVRTLREKYVQNPHYGRISVEQWDGKRLPYADAVVNLLVDTRSQSVPPVNDEMKRILAPRGVALAQNVSGEWKPMKPNRDGSSSRPRTGKSSATRRSVPA